MDESSKSQHTSVGNNPPSPQGGGGATTSSSKRKKPSTDHEELQDDADITNTPMKFHQTNSSTAGDHEAAATMNTGGSPRKEETINLLNDILDFYNKKGRFPYDSEDVDEFYKKWIERRTRVYRNEVDLNRNINELHVKFVKNLERTYGGEDIKTLMDPIDVKIYELSYRIWGKEDDIAFDHNDSKDSSKQETEDSKDLKASSEKETDDENVSKDSSSLNDSKDSSSLNDSSDSEDSSSNDSEDSSSLSDSEDSEDTLSDSENSEDTLSDSEDTSSLNSEDTSSDSEDSSSNGSKDSSTEQETNDKSDENDPKDSSSNNSKDSTQVIN